MNGFLDRLAARIAPDRSTVRPRPDVLLLAQLEPGTRPAAEPTAEDDEYPIGPPTRPRRRIQPSLPVAMEQTPPDQPAATPPPASRRGADPLPTSRSRPPLTPPPTSESGAETPPVQTPSVPAASARTIAATEPAAQPRRAPRFADNTTTTDPIRLLTSRPTSDPAAPPSTHPSPTIATPISILARPNESRADAEHRRQDTADTPPVEVIIDRIDVRLPSAPQPPRPPRSGPRAPMSLERYLESRENSPGRRTP